MGRTEPQREAWLIRRAHLMDPSTGVCALRDVLVTDGRVARMADTIPVGDVDTRRVGIIEAEGLWLWPGLVDLHVHFREPGFTHKETIASGGAAAARGGYTTVVCEPNTRPPIDSAGRVQELARKAREDTPVRVYVKAAMTLGREGKRPSDIEALAREPSVVALSDDGDPVTSCAVMAEVCRAAARVGLPLSPHCEDSPRALADYQLGAAPGFEPGEPYANEPAYIERDLRLAQRYGGPVHFSHVSLASSVELIRQFRARASRGVGVTFEVTPHHLLLSADDFETQPPRVTPPLRSAADRDALQAALVAGAVDAVASDHAPHTEQDKARGASGLIGLETTLGLVLTHFVHTGRLTPLAAACVLSTRPAQILGVAGGTLAVGQPADMVLIDPDEEWEVRADELASLSRNTPYQGWKLRGRAVWVAVWGRTAFVHSSLRQRVHPVMEAAGP